MARIYTNENFFYAVVDILRDWGHDVLTTKDARRANLGIPDEEVLAFAVSENRIVLTFNYRHFIRLHRLYPQHAGIIVCSEDRNYEALAHRIQDALESCAGNLDNQLIRIIKPNPTKKS